MVPPRHVRPGQNGCVGLGCVSPPAVAISVCRALRTRTPEKRKAIPHIRTRSWTRGTPVPAQTDVGMPIEWTPPMLATLTDERFDDPDWIFERKFDGIRCLAVRDADGGVRL